jgi:hypothetical protein
MLRQAQHDKFLLKLPVFFPPGDRYTKSCFYIFTHHTSQSCQPEPAEGHHHPTKAVSLSLTKTGCL